MIRNPSRNLRFDLEVFHIAVHIPLTMKFLPLLFLLLMAPLVQAQRPNGNGNNGTPAPSTPSASPAPTNILMWRCNLPGGSYSVALRAMVSVSLHEYLVDGVARVTEVNIDTTGNALARFYYIEPITPSSPVGIGQATIEKAQQLLQEGAQRSGQDVWQKVVKNYPTTTHAHTIEYRLADKTTLTNLYTSAEGALRLNQNTVFDGTSSSQADPTGPPQPPNNP